MIRTYRREEVYMEALRLQRLSWKRRLEAPTAWYKKDTFDNSHLPSTLLDLGYRMRIYDKLLTFIKPAYLIRDGSGAFGAVLTFNEALHLVLAPEILNSNYKDYATSDFSPDRQVDLGRYKYLNEVFVIEIMDK